MRILSKIQHAVNKYKLGYYTPDKSLLKKIRRHGLSADAVVPSLLEVKDLRDVPFANFIFSDSYYQLKTEDILQSQFGQDIFVLSTLAQKKNGFFVEIGVGDGKVLSNTYAMEKHYGWRGILAEPNNTYKQAIADCRSAILDTRAVYSESGETIVFYEDDESGMLSGIAEHHAGTTRHAGHCYDVQTVSLNELLATHQAPVQIDYMSIDTEGSEYEILKNFDFASYTVSCLTIEHNYELPKLMQIKKLLEQHGYQHKYSEISRCDAWFVHESVTPV